MLLRALQGHAHCPLMDDQRSLPWAFFFHQAPWSTDCSVFLTQQCILPFDHVTMYTLCIKGMSPP